MFTVFDLETTGFSSIVNDVIQFAYITYDENNMIVKAESLYFYYEGMSWSEDAYNVHHISQDFLKQHEDKFEENLVKMYATLMNANVCGHNAVTFDCPFAINWLARMGLPRLQYRCIQDTMLQLRPISRKPKIKLIKLAEMMGITDEITQKLTLKVFGDEIANQAHNAAFDTMRTGLLTIMGINKNYISFAGDEADVTLYTDEDLEIGESGIPEDNLLIRIKENGVVTPILLTSPTQYQKDVTSSYSSLVGTTQCIEGVFEFCGNTKNVKLYVLRRHQSRLIFSEMLDKPNSCSIQIQLRDNMPEQEFYDMANRSAFVSSFNKDIDSLEWRFEDV